MGSFKNKQLGISFSGFIMVAFVVIIVAILGMKTIPSYVHSAQIASIFKAIVADTEMRSASEKEILESYRKRAEINGIADLKGEDILIDKEDNSLTLSANYSVKVPLAGNVTLLLEFNPSSR